MKAYKIHFEARFTGAQGKFSKFTKTVKAENFKAAQLILYDTYDHIRTITVNNIKYDPFNEPA